MNIKILIRVQKENNDIADNDITGLWASRTFYEVKGFISFYWWLAESHLSGCFLPFTPRNWGSWWGPTNNIFFVCV